MDNFIPEKKILEVQTKQVSDVNSLPSPVMQKTLVAAPPFNPHTTSAPAYQVNRQIYKKVKLNCGNVKYKCHLCPWESTTYSKTVRHIALKHLRDKLTEIYGSGQTCNLCNKVFHDPKSIFGHLVKLHGALKSEIPGKNQFSV